MSEHELTAHYGRTGVVDEVLTKLGLGAPDDDNAGGDDNTGPLDPGALAGVDEFHLGGRAATTALLADLDLGPDDRVLDVGSGIGGAARTMATTIGCRVTGVDLTPAFVELARRLTAATGLADRVGFQVGSALDLPFADATEPDEGDEADEGGAADGGFDAVTMLHVGMNIADKDGLMAELARVVRPGGTVAVYDVMLLGDEPSSEPLGYPMPWSPDEANSHLAGPDRYRSAMGRAGLTPGPVVDRRPLVLEVLERAATAGPPPVHLGHLMGGDWPTMFGNLRAAMQAGLVAPTQITATRPG